MRWKFLYEIYVRCVCVQSRTVNCLVNGSGYNLSSTLSISRGFLTLLTLFLLKILWFHYGLCTSRIPIKGLKLHILILNTAARIHFHLPFPLCTTSNITVFFIYHNTFITTAAVVTSASCTYSPSSPSSNYEQNGLLHLASQVSSESKLAVELPEYNMENAIISP